MGWEDNSACFALLYLKMSVSMANGDGDIICKQITIRWLYYFHSRYLLLLLDTFFLANILCILWKCVIIKDGILISAPQKIVLSSLLISSFPTYVLVAYMAHAHRVNGMASFPWSSYLELEQRDSANISMAKFKLHTQGGDLQPQCGCAKSSLPFSSFVIGSVICYIL